MISRRNFIGRTSLISAGVIAFPQGLFSGCRNQVFASGRPSVLQRRFSSKAVDKAIAETTARIKDPELAWMFGNCFPNTLDTTVEYEMINGVPDTFVITGDIHAMWLRDSTAQVWPYLPYVNEDTVLYNLILGVIHRQGKCIVIDPYANAFNKGKGQSEWMDDLTDMKPELHERKWEIDSLCYPVRLAYHFWKKTGDKSFYTTTFENALLLTLKTFTEQQRKEGKGPYRFSRKTEKATDTLPGNGYGNPVRPVGLICSSFRPSDDATIFPFLIPSNFFAVETLKQMAEIFTKIKKDNELASLCIRLADEIRSALKEYAISDHLGYGPILAFEADGFGNKLFMDDANVPSLLSLPYMGCISGSDPLYINTRKFILSKDNPWYFEGKAGKGIGGPHVGEEMIWPLSIIMQAMTSDDEKEIRECLGILKNTHAGTGFMHESFHRNDPSHYTRRWFAWANTIFGEMITKIAREHPAILAGVI